jgi:chromosome segregation ATPase
MLNLNAQLQQLKSSAVELEKMISAQGDRLATLNQQIQRLQQQQLGTRLQRGMQLAQELEQLSAEREELVEQLRQSNQRIMSNWK